MEEILSFLYIPTSKNFSCISTALSRICRALEISKLEEYYLKDSEVRKTDTYKKI